MGREVQPEKAARGFVWALQAYRDEVRTARERAAPGERTEGRIENLQWSDIQREVDTYLIHLHKVYPSCQKVTLVLQLRFFKTESRVPVYVFPIYHFLLKRVPAYLFPISHFLNIPSLPISHFPYVS